MGIFKPPADSRRRNKILVWGPSGSGKSTLALEFPKAAYIDNHGSVEKYESGYMDHFYAHVADADDTLMAINELVNKPGDRRTVVLDDVTTYWTQVQTKWCDIMLKRNYGGKGDKKDFYAFQPSDWIHPKRELASNVRKLINLDMNLIVIARATKEYKGEGEDFMKIVGETFAGEKNLPYEFDFILELRHQDGKRTIRVHKQRIAKGTRPLPDEFEFTLDETGNSFFRFFKDFCRPDDFERLPEINPVPEPEPEPEVVPPPASEPETPEPSAPPITAAQLKKLANQVKATFPDKKAWVEYLGQWAPGVTSAKQLTEAQATKIIANLDDIPF